MPPGAKYKHDDKRAELMADALSGYFLAHDEGGNFDSTEIGIFDETAFATGDCATSRVDHHGTPDQRKCAAIWGASLARYEINYVPILDPEVFVNSFNGAYMEILDLKEKECTLVSEETTSTDVVDVDSEDFDNEELQGYEQQHWDNMPSITVDLDGKKVHGTMPSFSIEKEETDDSDSKQQPSGSSSSSSKNDHEEEIPVKIEDWLNSIEDQNQQNQDSSELKDQLGQDQSGSLWEAQDGYTNGRGRPSSSSSSSSSSQPAANDNSMSTGDRGAPSSTSNQQQAIQEGEVPNHLDSARTVSDCQMPWAHCYSSSASGRDSTAAPNAVLFGIMCSIASIAFGFLSQV